MPKLLKYAIEMKISEFFKYATQQNKEKCRDDLNKKNKKERIIKEG